jgi:hypothetical protein
MNWYSKHRTIGTTSTRADYNPTIDSLLNHCKISKKILKFKIG